ncbi:MAG: hypothetical protein ACR2RE_24020 [Geminicoccaceae bacterium]
MSETIKAIMPAQDWWALHVDKGLLLCNPIMAFAVWEDGIFDGLEIEGSCPISEATNFVGYYRSSEPPKAGELDPDKFVDGVGPNAPSEWFANHDH